MLNLKLKDKFKLSDWFRLDWHLLDIFINQKKIIKMWLRIDLIFKTTF